MNDIISVIIPVYNVEKYIDRCIESIIKQTYKELEIILVDDGSTDNSGVICDKWKVKDERIKVLHQTNQGLGPARNLGLDIACGEWVSFIDSDDWIEPETYKYMVEACFEFNCEIATCGRKNVSSKKVFEYVFCSEQNHVFDRKNAIRHYLLQNMMNMSACDKLFKRKLFDDIRFPAGYTSEDIVPIYNVLKRIDRICLTGKPFYNYFYREGSLSRSNFNKKLLGTYIYPNQVKKDIANCYPDLIEEANSFFYGMTITVFRAMRASGYKKNEFDDIYMSFKNNKEVIIKNRYLKKWQKLYVVLAIYKMDRVLDFIYCLIKKIKRGVL